MHTHLKALRVQEGTDAGCDVRTEEENIQMRSLGSQIPNPSFQNPNPYISESCNGVKKSLVGSWNDTRLEEPEENDEKLRRKRLFKFPAPTNWSTGSRFTFCAFPCLVILPMPFSVEIPNF